MKIIKDKIFENPNKIIKPEIWKKYKDDYNWTPARSNTVQYNEAYDNIPFGYYGKGKNKIMVIGDYQDTHYDVWLKAGRKLLNKKDKPTVRNVLEEIGEERGPSSGRLFPVYKVITFWKFPEDYNELQEVIKDLNEEISKKQNISHVKIDDTWLIEIPSGEYKNFIHDPRSGWGSWQLRAGHQKYIPITEYKGGYKRTEKEMNIQHIESPMQKQKRDVPVGIGSKRYAEKKPLAFRQALQTSESFYPRLK